jgi:hypothetical protein
MSDTAPAKSAASPVPVWNCSFAPGAQDGVALNALTVGAKFDLKCHGEIAVAWRAGEPVRVAFAKDEQAYTLQVLQTKTLDPQDAEFVVTGYKPGKQAPEYVRLVQKGGAAGSGEIGFEFDKPQWEIRSVLKPNQPPSPYGPYGPFALRPPLWIFVTAGLLLALLIVVVYRWVRRTSQRRRMLESLKRHRTALSPLHQFYRDARGLRRRLHGAKTAEELKTITEDLDREFRLYVLRQFEIPTLDWSDNEILADLRRRHKKVFERARDPLKRTLRELVRLKSGPQVLLQDVEQMHEMSLDAAETLESAREGERK